MSGVESIRPDKVAKKKAKLAQKQAKLAQKAEKLKNKREARFNVWAKRIDGNGDGKISRAELEARIAQRQAAGKLHPFASKVLESLSTLDKDATDGLDATLLADAAKFLAEAYPVAEKRIKKLDISS
jgi:hypothetical protein